MMNTKSSYYFSLDCDVVVIGGGHAGVEAALATARMGFRTILLTINLDTIAQMSCNPAIGGIAKGQVVREIDALGGEMAKAADKTGIHFRMLNTSKGPAVWSPRVQSDKKAYQFYMKKVCEETPNLILKQDTAKEIAVSGSKVKGVIGESGCFYNCKACILATGTFMQGLIHIGNTKITGGRFSEPASFGLSECLRRLGFKLGRLKTGTSPRLNGRTIDFSRMQIQEPDKTIFPFSYSTKVINQKQVNCYITYTNARTIQIIRDNLHRAPLYTGQIQSTGPRYCPSIEVKVVRFPEKENHQIFLEPEGLNTLEFYCNGLSTSLPIDVQEEMVHSIEGLEHAEIMRYGYAIEYDFSPPEQLYLSLETKLIENLFFAGQINGTSGYEEAAGQGLIAGINCGRKLQNKPPLILKRSEAYIGVMIDDLVTRGIDEPYRLFTSRAEHRLLLRYDNANFRLMKYGHDNGLINNEVYEEFQKKEKLYKLIQDYCHRKYYQGKTLAQHICANPDSLAIFLQEDDYLKGVQLPEDLKETLQIDLKYEGYIERELKMVERMKRLENKKIPRDIDYSKLPHLRQEAREKLSKFKPENLAQASRISGITPADITTLMIYLGI